MARPWQEESSRQETGNVMYAALITTVHANVRKCEALARGQERAVMACALDAKTAAFRRGRAWLILPATSFSTF